ncbi:hypothetical protein CRENPOLYSF2_1480006 [Crenothrix polyspora]|uniref:Uncharacterized protein n=1 Tax=Crenothrix polyspora TaxID=360316 RepID=A0A1R4H1M4_9GAMM|nr:hypothetical protein CRENPOLYSF2_1480006 [Crenothrix polyspora]
MTRKRSLKSIPLFTNNHKLFSDAHVNAMIENEQLLAKQFR